MRTRTRIALTLAALQFIGGPVRGEEAPAFTRAEIEQDLAITARPFDSPRVRPGEPLRVRATLVNRSPERTHKVINPGAGSELGLVEPFVYYTARYQPHDGEAREIVAALLRGMCGMGDHRWIQRVVDLGPGESLEFGTHMASATMTLDVKQPGRYDVQVHYEYRARGTTEKLPRSDPIGALGPLESTPPFKISSPPVRFDVVRPFEVFVEVTGTLAKGVTKPVSELVTVRVENGSVEPLTLRNNELEVTLHVLPVEGTARIRRTSMAFPAVVLTKELAPGEGMTIIGPQTGWFDEEWTPLEDGPVELRVEVARRGAAGAGVRSHVARVPGS